MKYFWSSTGSNMPVEITEQQYNAIREYGEKAVSATCNAFSAFQMVAGYPTTVSAKNLEEFYRITELREDDDWKEFFRPKLVHLSGMIQYQTKGLTL